MLFAELMMLHGDDMADVATHYLVCLSSGWHAAIEFVEEFCTYGILNRACCQGLATTWDRVAFEGLAGATQEQHRH